jgi:hypothetical protein
MANSIVILVMKWLTNWYRILIVIVIVYVIKMLCKNCIGKSAMMYCSPCLAVKNNNMDEEKIGLKETIFQSLLSTLGMCAVSNNQFYILCIDEIISYMFLKKRKTREGGQMKCQI